MSTIKVKCDHCHKMFDRPIGRYNEAIKFGWKQFCSSECLSQSRLKRVNTACSNPRCNRSISRPLNQVNKSKLLFCSISCSTSYYNSIRKSCSKLRKCRNLDCNNYIKSVEHKNIYCSRSCAESRSRGTSKYTRDKILSLIREFHNAHSRIPVKLELGYLNRRGREIFGTWNKAIVAAGYDPNPVMFAKQHTARDGHRCDSMAEKILDDWLNRRGIEHEVNVLYPWNNGMTADFVVGDIWIEIFGLAGEHKRYDELKRLKLKLAREYGIHILGLGLRDVYGGEIGKKLKILD